VLVKPGRPTTTIRPRVPGDELTVAHGVRYVRAVAIPERPLSVHPEFARRMRIGFVVCAFLGLLPTVASIYVAVDGVGSILSDQSVWDAGKQGHQVSVTDRNKVKFVFVSYKLDASWVDDRGTSHHGKAEWETILGVTTPRMRGELRYDPADPDRFVVRAAIETIGARWLFVVVVGGICSVLGIILLIAAWEMRGRLRLARLCAVRSEVVECELVSQKRVMGKNGATGWALVRFRLQPHAPIRKQRLYVRELGPLWANDAKTRVYALRSPSAPDRPLVLAADLYPLAPRT